MFRKLLVILVASASPLVAQETSVPQGGTVISDFSKASAFITPAMGTAANSGSLWQITVRTARPETYYEAQLNFPLDKLGITKDDWLLMIVRARVIGGNAGNLRAKIQLSKAPYTQATPELSFEVAEKWAEYPVLFRATSDLPPGTGGLVLSAGQLVQQLEISAATVIHYPKLTDTTRFPQIKHTYLGRESTAPWRQQALDRIEKLRKKDLTLRILSPDGKPLAGRKVKLTQVRSEFGFGTAVPAAMLSDDTPDAEKFRKIVDRNFSMITFENDLKDMFWGDDQTAEQKVALRKQIDDAFAWSKERGIKVRGHYLMQNAKPSNLAAVTDPAIIQNHFMTTARERLAFVSDRVTEWDAINHPVAWDGADLLSNEPSLRRLDREIFSLARKTTRLPLYVNEDQIFRPGRQSDETFSYLSALKRDGFKISGLGNQAHFDASFLPSMDKIQEITDRFSKLVPVQMITEFDVNTGNDEDLAADYTRDLLITCYSLPAYRGFIFWGFWEGNHWIKDCASWNRDWTIRARGQVIEEWIGNRWRSRLEATTDMHGVVRWRGFPGRYLMESDSLSIPFEATTASPNPVVRTAVLPQ
jgi:GH35 family endo-1,4-beta-xylanase